MASQKTGKRVFISKNLV